MNKGSRFQRLSRFLLSQLPRSQLAQFVIDQRQELLRGMRIALLDGGKNARDFGHGGQYTALE
jgi:hypothetical protein